MSKQTSTNFGTDNLTVIQQVNDLSIKACDEMLLEGTLALEEYDDEVERIREEYRKELEKE